MVQTTVVQTTEEEQRGSLSLFSLKILCLPPPSGQNVA